MSQRKQKANLKQLELYDDLLRILEHTASGHQDGAPGGDDPVDPVSASFDHPDNAPALKRLSINSAEELKAIVTFATSGFAVEIEWRATAATFSK